MSMHLTMLLASSTMMCLGISLSAPSDSMEDLIPILLFVGCLLATFGLVRVCEWLRPVGQSQRPEQPGSREVVSKQAENDQ